MSATHRRSSKERMLSAISCARTSEVPCCFMAFQSLRKACRNDFVFFERQLELGFDSPDFLHELIGVVAGWARRRLEIVLDIGVDLVIKRAWYEGTELWSPALFQEFIAPVLRDDVALVHSAGARFGYINTSGTRAIFQHLLDLGVDVLIGVDPVQGVGTHLELFSKWAAGRMCLWGGVSAPMTVEPATQPEPIWEAVERAVAVCGSRGGFVLSPVDNLFDSSARVWQNVIQFVEAWKRFQAQSS